MNKPTKICHICNQVIPYKEVFGEKIQPYGTVRFKPKEGKTIKYTHCFQHSIEEVDTWIKEQNK